MPLPPPSRPCPSRPREALPARAPCWAPLSRGRRAALGPRPSRVGCRRALRHLFLLLFCFQPTREQREKPGPTDKQIQSEETERQRFRGRSPERRRQGGRMPPRARPPSGRNQVSSHSLTLGQNVRLDGVHVDTGWRPRSGQSQPLSLIMCASSMMYLPSLYFWLLSKACS